MKTLKYAHKIKLSPPPAALLMVYFGRRPSHTSRCFIEWTDPLGLWPRCLKSTLMLK